MPRSASGHADGAAHRARSPESAHGTGASAGPVIPADRGGFHASWRLRNWSLRTKLVAVLLIPTLTALVLIGLRFNSQVASAGRLAELSARASTDAAVSRLVHVLQRERDLTVHYVANGRKGKDGELRKQRARVNEKLGAFNKALAEARPDLSASSAAGFAALRERLDELSRLRFGSQHNAYPADAVLRSYSELISAMLSARERAVATISEPELVRLQLAGSALSRVKDQMSVTRALVDEALIVGGLGPDRKRLLHGAEAERQAWLIDFRKFAAPDQQRMYDDTVTGLIVDLRNDILESVIVRTDNGRSLAGLDRQKWDTSATYTANLAYNVEEAMLWKMQDRTDALASDARTAALRDGAIVIGLLVIAVLLAMVIARSLIRPLRTLRSTALEVAEYRLPAAVHGLLADPQSARVTEVAPVPVNSSEEVGQVARAFDAVHGEAVRLAAEQAELRKNVNSMFLNLSRRGQELADRQLDVLDRMEANEQNPDTLAALFELDHLATRSRRICENLLVLTGNDFARMLPGSVPASEVIGAALSEIEHYQRVELSSAPEIAVRGNAVSDVVHVISELLENATNESGPNSHVLVSSSVKKDGGWLVEITDRGQGMPQGAIDSVNIRLAEPPEVDVEASRRMGLFVVARLAQRNGIDVRLRAGQGGGLTAAVLVPARLIGDIPADATPESAAEPGRRPDWLDKTTPRAADVASRPRTAGPPKRAPIVNRPATEQAAGHGAYPLDEDQPTERLPVYRDLLTKWFTETDQRVDAAESKIEAAEKEAAEKAEPVVELPPVPEPVAEDQEPSRAHQIDPPTVRSAPRVHAANGVNYSGPPSDDLSREFAPPARGRLDLHNGRSETAKPTEHEGVHELLDLVRQGQRKEAGTVAVAKRAGAISRAPEDVRARMLSLSDGVRRARQARTGEYADHGQTPTVGAGRHQRPTSRAGFGGKEG